MTIGGENDDYHLVVMNLIHKTMLLRDATTPTPMRLTLELFGTPDSCSRM